MNKKSQLAIFFLFVIIILIAMSFLIYLNSIKTKRFETEVSQIKEPVFSVAPVKSNMDFCIEEIATDAVRYIGLFGGYYIVPEPKLNYFDDDVPYYVYLGENNIPNLNRIEKEISTYMIDSLPDCVAQLNITFKDLEIQGKINSVDTNIGDEYVFFDIDYPILVSKGDSKTEISKFVTKAPVRLKTIYEIALNISRTSMEDRENLCIDCLLEIASNNEVFIDIYPYEQSSLIFTIFDNVTKVDGDDYIFTFAIS